MLDRAGARIEHPVVVEGEQSVGEAGLIVAGHESAVEAKGPHGLAEEGQKGAERRGGQVRQLNECARKLS